MFENLLGNLRERFEESRQRKKLEREDIARMQREVDFQKKEIFQEEFKKNALEVARAQAKEEAASKSGIQKMRAQNRLRNLERNNVAPGSFFERFSEYTQKNLAKREENLKRTQDTIEEAKKMKEGRLSQGKIIPGTKPFTRKPPFSK